MGNLVNVLLQNNIVTGSFTICRGHIHNTFFAVCRFYPCSCIVIVHSTVDVSVLNLQLKWPYIIGNIIHGKT